jgi:RimJ/RimL family protein N-acetyltransferase
MMGPELQTERLRLRQWREEDIEPYAMFFSGAAARFVGGVCTREDAWRRMAAMVGHWALRGYGVWALELKANGGFAGYSGLWYPLGWPEPEILWSLMPAVHGRGYATEAARRVRDYAYRELGWSTAISCIAGENLPSQHVARRLGAAFERTTELRGAAIGIYRHPGPTELQQQSS